MEQKTVNLPPVGVSHEAEVGRIFVDTGTVGINNAVIIATVEAKAPGKHAGANCVMTVPPGNHLFSDAYGAALRTRDASFNYDHEPKERQGSSQPDTSLSADSKMLVVNVNDGLGFAHTSVPGHLDPIRRITTDLGRLCQEMSGVSWR